MNQVLQSFDILYIILPMYLIDKDTKSLVKNTRGRYYLNIYYAFHNLLKKLKIIQNSKDLEYYINNKLNKFLNAQTLKITKLWFVITKNLGVIKKHSHLTQIFQEFFILR